MEFRDRTVVVTGGTGALGTVVVGELLAAGARCRIPYVLQKEADAFPYKDSVELVPDCDLTDESAVARLYEGFQGKLYASIHIAGGFAMSNLADTDKQGLMAMLNANLISCHLCSRAALHAFGADGGRIVNVAARKALEPQYGAGMSAYVVSKAAVAALTQALAAEVASKNVLVNAVAPSIIDTPANRAAMPGAAHDTWPTPREIASTILFLASPRNRVTSGAVVPVYGRA
ncbi:MAG TPA: SDR family oxidoreductase [Paucimonas sp.]|nr:SDR family oxidoreductase [Paucimonas sp.]